MKLKDTLPTLFSETRIFIGDFGGREGIRILGLLVANEEKIKLRCGATTI
jgi:hypothetical protein